MYKVGITMHTTKIAGLFEFAQCENMVVDGKLILNPWFGKTMYSLFPCIVTLDCGCRCVYQTIDQFPSNNHKCIHNNYFVYYDLPCKQPAT